MPARAKITGIDAVASTAPHPADATKSTPSPAGTRPMSISTSKSKRTFSIHPLFRGSGATPARPAPPLAQAISARVDAQSVLSMASIATGMHHGSVAALFIPSDSIIRPREPIRGADEGALFSEDTIPFSTRIEQGAGPAADIPKGQSVTVTTESEERQDVWLAKVEEKEHKEREGRKNNENERTKLGRAEGEYMGAETNEASEGENITLLMDSPRPVSNNSLPGTVPSPPSPPISISSTATKNSNRPSLHSLKFNSARGNEFAPAGVRRIQDLNTIPYPEAINPPSRDLNIAATPGKFRYDRNFLLQFMDICKQRPDSLLLLDTISNGPDVTPSYSISGNGNELQTDDEKDLSREASAFYASVNDTESGPDEKLEQYNNKLHTRASDILSGRILHRRAFPLLTIETVAHALANLVKGARPTSQDSLRRKIAQLVFARATQETMDFVALRCALLCHQLMLTGPTIVTEGSTTAGQSSSVHEYVFQLCEASLDRHGRPESVDSVDNVKWSRSQINAPGHPEGKPVGRATCFVAELYRVKLLSVAQVHGYLGRLIHSDAVTSDYLAALCDLLVLHGQGLDVEPWKNETDLILEWISGVKLEAATQRYIMVKVGAVIELRSKCWRPINLSPAPASTRFIEDLNAVSYPEEIKPPSPHLNPTATLGKFRYDREFLLQFANVCKKRPDRLCPLGAFGLEPVAGAAASGHLASVWHPTNSGGIDRRGESKETKSIWGQRGSNGGQNIGVQPAETEIPAPPEPVEPLRQSENRWIAWTPRGTPEQAEFHTLLKHKVTSLLNKLTSRNFDSISDQVTKWTNHGDRAISGPLRHVTKLVFETAKGQAMFSRMYALLCQRIMEGVSPTVQDKQLKNTEGQPMTGAMLFRIYLLSWCQAEFEHVWPVKETGVHVGSKTTELILYLDECHVTFKAKPQGLDLVRFIGDLFKLEVLTKRIVHQCIKKLLMDVADPEEEIESICKLLTTTGHKLDNAKARYHMDIYFERMEKIVKGSTINSRMQFLLQDVIDLRARRWQARAVTAQPSTFNALNKQKRREEAAPRNASQYCGSHPVEDHGGHSPQADQRNVVGGASTAPPPANFSDISQFYKATRSTGPSSTFTEQNQKSRKESLPKASSGAVMITARDSAGPDRQRPRGQGIVPVAEDGRGRARSRRKRPRSEANQGAAGEIAPGAVFVVPTGLATVKTKKGDKGDIKEYLSAEAVEEPIMVLDTSPERTGSCD